MLTGSKNVASGQYEAKLIKASLTNKLLEGFFQWKCDEYCQQFHLVNATFFIVLYVQFSFSNIFF